MSEHHRNRGSVVSRKARTAARLPRSVVLLSVAIWILLWLARLVTLIVPIRYLSKALGEDRGIDSTLAAPDPCETLTIKKLKMAMDIATRHHPLNNICYAEALIAHLMLSLVSIEHVVKFGVRRDHAAAAIKAHAWVIAGEKAVCGGHCSGDYTVVRCFVSKRA